MIQYLYLGRVAYDEALLMQEELVALRYEGRVCNTLLLLEHPPVLTLGRNAKRSNVLASDDLLASRGVTLHQINRGGDVTYHGPGQLVGYPIFDLRSLRGPNGGRLGPVDFVRRIEEVLIRLCGVFGVRAGRIAGLTGVWCGLADGRPLDDSGNPVPERLPSGAEAPDCSGDAMYGLKPVPFPSHFAEHSPIHFPEHFPSHFPEHFPVNFLEHTSIHSPAPLPAPSGERKIGAIGIHVSRGITSHGFAFNVTTDLRDFGLINPCGITDRPVTSVELEVLDRGSLPNLEAVAHQVARQFGQVFSQQILAVESLDRLLSQAAEAAFAQEDHSVPEFPAEDTPMRVPSEVERLKGRADRPAQA
jgi:lipoate-protein ligase B